MIDFHHNIFFYYRGPEPSKPEQKEQQLENNTTKALTNTLSYCSPVVAQKFLKSLGITTSGKVEIELQRNIDIANIGPSVPRLLLGLIDKAENNEDSIRAGLKKSGDRDSRPDAYLYGEDFVVLIESKVGNSKLELNQMQYHYQKLKKSAIESPKFKVHTWAEIYQFFVRLLPELKCKDQFLVEQFTQYLEYKGMSEFSGFEQGMFDFFVNDEKDPDTKQWIRGTMDLFGKKISHGLQVLNPLFYEIYHVGNFSVADDHFWVAFGREKNFGKYAHQTIKLYDYGLDVCANIELMPAVMKLKEKILSDELKFREIVSGLPKPFIVCIEERKHKQASIYDYQLKETLKAGVSELYDPESNDLSDPKSNGFDKIKLLLNQIPFPYIYFKKCIEREHILELSSKGKADDLINEILAIMIEFDTLVEYINR